MNRTKIKLFVDYLLDTNDLRTIPIDLNRVAKIAGATITHDKLDAGLSGFAYQKNGTRLIAVNSDEGETRKRFTTAHELGHLFLHKNRSVSYDQGLMMLRVSHSSKGTDINEIEANRFAAELLMPEEEVRKDIAKLGSIDLMSENPETRKHIDKLAERYQVSPRAMSVRLATLYFN
jgi:Zn-dependent peptidase ImmA (M78 family)